MRNEAVDQEAGQDPCSQQDERIRPRRLDRHRSRLPHGVKGIGCVDQAFCPPVIFPSRMNLQVVALVILMRMNRDAVAGEAC